MGVLSVGGMLLSYPPAGAGIAVMAVLATMAVASVLSGAVWLWPFVVLGVTLLIDAVRYARWKKHMRESGWQEYHDKLMWWLTSEETERLRREISYPDGRPVDDAASMEVAYLVNHAFEELNA